MTQGAAHTLETARALIAAGRNAEAANICEERLRTVAAGVEASLFEGLLHTIKGRPNDAVAAYDTALSFAPDALAAYQGIAQILADKGWLFSAVVVMENAREAASFTPEAQVQLDELRARLADLTRTPPESAP